MKFSVYMGVPLVSRTPKAAPEVVMLSSRNSPYPSTGLSKGMVTPLASVQGDVSDRVSGTPFLKLNTSVFVFCDIVAEPFSSLKPSSQDADKSIAATVGNAIRSFFISVKFRGLKLEIRGLGR